MKKLILVLSILLVSSSAAFAQADKWQRDLFQILEEIKDSQTEILDKITALENKQADITKALEDLKKTQKSYVNPKWTP